jgi:hypothetical protein
MPRVASSSSSRQKIYKSIYGQSGGYDMSLGLQEPYLRTDIGYACIGVCSELDTIIDETLK